MEEDEFEYLEPKLSQLVNLMAKPVRESFIIKGKPDHHLGACIRRCPQYVLDLIAEEYGVEPGKGKGSRKQCGLLEQKITEELFGRLELIPCAKVKLLTELALGEGDIKDIADSFSLVRKGWIFLYMTEDEQTMIPVVPCEIVEKLNEFAKDEGFAMHLIYYKMFRSYISGMLELYGVFEKKWLLDVMKMHDAQKSGMKDDSEEKIIGAPEKGWSEEPEESVEKVLSGLQKELSSFGMENGYLFDPDLKEDEEYKDLIERVRDKPYYKPTIEDILYYRENDVDVHLKEYRMFKQYLREKVDSDIALEWLMEEFSIEVVEELGGIFSISEMIERYEISFSSMEDMKEFERLLRNWEDRVRKWNNRGFTNIEMKEQGKKGSWAKLGFNMDEMEFKEKTPDPDAPCPCGSGKKYRQCCGRADK